ncbi:MAG: 50S ribosomal protein L3 [Acidobacteriota bacterium]|jgi:large subunit ribosomal protein L3
MEGILGKKLGMTQVYREDGTAVPVTVVQAGPCTVVQVKDAERDGYRAAQLGLVEENPPKRVPKPLVGHFEKAGVPPTRRLVEFDLAGDEEVAAGDQVKCSIFAEDDYVDVTGRSKGKGFQGVMKRHGFHGGRATHGSMFHRAPGSIGQAAFPSRVFPGTRLPGQTGNERITVKNLQVVKVDEENNLLYLKGAVPGAKNAFLRIRRARRG